MPALAILQEIHKLHLIPLDGRPHLASAVRQYNGDARAHWDGDTLVVETTNFSPRSDVQDATAHVRVVERFTRAGPDRLDWELTFSDEQTWTMPWTVRIQLGRSDDAIYEYACHEGNYAMAGILSGHRAAERRALAAASR